MFLSSEVFSENKMDSLPEISIPHIDACLKYMTFNTEYISDYVAAIGSHISDSRPIIQQYLSKLPSVQLGDQVECFYLLLAGAVVVIMLVVGVAIKTKLDSKKISNKYETKKYKARNEKSFTKPSELESHTGAPGDKKGSALLSNLSSYFHLPFSSNDNKLEGSKGEQGTGKLKTWFSLGKSETLEQQSSSGFERNPTNQINLMKKMCGEFREASKLKNKDEREERQKELEKFRGARSYFQTIDKSLRSNPGVKLRSEDTIEGFTRENHRKLATFTPGKISSKFSAIFEGKPGRETTPEKPPKKRIYNAEKLFNKSKETEMSADVCKPGEVTQWTPSSSLLTNDSQRTELEEVRKSRSAVAEKLAVERSLSAAPRLKLADDVWVTEKPEDNLWQEKQRTRQELEQLKQSRMETVEFERPSSRLEELLKLQSIKELEQVKKVRSTITENVENEGELQSSLKQEERVLSGGIMSEEQINQTAEELFNSIAPTDLLGRRVEEFSKKADCSQFDVALALAMEGLEVSNESYHEEVDEEFESQKKLIEEELQRIVMQDSDPDMVADKILSAAESIQKLANNSGNDDINLSPSIERLKTLKTGQPGENIESVHVAEPEQEPEPELEPEPVSTKLQKPLPNNNCEADKLTSINAVPKIKFRPDEEMFINKTNYKRNTIELAKFNRSDKIRSKFEETTRDNNELSTFNIHPKKKIISFEDILLKNNKNSSTKTNEKELELEMIKNFRKSWVPPEEETTEFRTRLEPGKLQITNPYINDRRENEDRAKEERRRELEEVRKSFAEKKENDQLNIETCYQKPLLAVVSRQRSRSEMRSKMSDDFWVKERNSKLEEEKVKIREELDNVKTTRQMFVDDFSSRKENENTKSETFQDLEQLRSVQLNKTSNVEKVRHDLELLESTAIALSETDSNSQDKNRNIGNFSSVETNKNKDTNIQTIERDNSGSAPARGRKRELKSSREKEKTTVRSKSLSSIKNAGNKLKSLANEKLRNVMKNNQKL